MAYGGDGEEREVSFRELFKPGNVGWILTLTSLLVAAGLVWNVTRTLQSGESVLGGPGSTVEDYGFDFSTCLVEKDLIVPSGISRDGMKTLDDPEVVPGSSVAAVNKEMRGKFLVPDDRVIGVVLDGKARAYPLPIMNWHEVVNDSLGGTPIVVTYHPLCDSIAVFERTMEGEVLEFGVSGLLYNSSQLIFDRQTDPGASSLWSQLQARAVCGPAAESGLELKRVVANLTRWSVWLERYPETTVVRGLAEEMGQNYKMNPYGVYYNSPSLRYPVNPPPPPISPRPKERCVVIRLGDDRTVFTERQVAELTGGKGKAPVPIEHSELEFHYLPGNGPAPPVMEVFDSEGRTPEGVIYSLWFAWHATHPKDILYGYPKQTDGSLKSPQ
jgi:hypothetical protein